jgi:hypothetical protein
MTCPDLEPKASCRENLNFKSLLLPSFYCAVILPNIVVMKREEISLLLAVFSKLASLLAKTVENIKSEISGLS